MVLDARPREHLWNYRTDLPSISTSSIAQKKIKNKKKKKKKKIKQEEKKGKQKERKPCTPGTPNGKNNALPHESF